MQGDPSLCIHHFSYLSHWADILLLVVTYFHCIVLRHPVSSRGLGGKGRKKEQIIFPFSRSAPIGNEPASKPSSSEALNVMMKKRSVMGRRLDRKEGKENGSK